jgi:hypothetical protein
MDAIMMLIHVTDNNGNEYSIHVTPGKDLPAGAGEGLRTYRLNDGRCVLPTTRGQEEEFLIPNTEIILRKI